MSRLQLSTGDKRLWDFAASETCLQGRVRRVQADRAERGDLEHQALTLHLQAVVSAGHLLCGQQEKGPPDSPPER